MNITRPEQRKRPTDYLFAVSFGLILLLVCWLGAWSNRFGNSFHFDDIPTIVTNPSLSHLSNIPKYFTNPRTFSTLKETSDYPPLPFHMVRSRLLAGR